MDLSMLLHKFVKNDTWISLICYMVQSKLLKLLYGYVKFILCICSRLLPNKTKLKFDQDFKSFLKIMLRTKVVERVKVLKCLDGRGPTVPTPKTQKCFEEKKLLKKFRALLITRKYLIISLISHFSLPFPLLVSQGGSSSASGDRKRTL